MAGAGACTTLEELAALLARPSDWAWFEVMVGLRFGRGDGAGSWTADEVWNRACDPWAVWLR